MINDLSAFWNKVDKTSSCWLWTGLTHPFGYGRIGINKVKYLTHRLSYIIHFGPIPKGMCVCHRCDNPKCVNPQHLFLGSRLDNNLDRTAKDRTFKGSQVTKSKLLEHQILEIRQSTESVKSLAKKYKVSGSTIYAIRNRTNWRHIN